MDRTTVLQQVQAWPQEDQLDFVFSLWDHLVDSGWQPALTKEVKAELDRRIAAHQADPTKVVTWEELVEHVRRPR